MKKFIACLTVVLISSLGAFAANDEREADRVKDAGVVLKEILNIPDDIPQDLLDKAECLIILPSVKKGASGIGGSYGRGVMICRSGGDYTGKWGAPALYSLEGLNIGFQLGGQATDFVLLVMNTKGAELLLTRKVKLGADASAAAGRLECCTDHRGLLLLPRAGFRPAAINGRRGLYRRLHHARDERD